MNNWPEDPRNPNKGPLSRSARNPTASRASLPPLSPRKSAPVVRRSSNVKVASVSPPVSLSTSLTTPPRSPRGERPPLNRASASSASLPVSMTSPRSPRSESTFKFLEAVREQLMRVKDSPQPEQVDLAQAPSKILTPTGSLSKNWEVVLCSLSVAECCATLVHYLRKLEDPIINTQLVRWFTDNEAVTDEMHRFQLFLSLVYSLPKRRLDVLKLLSDLLADFNLPNLGSALMRLPVNHFAGSVFVDSFLKIPDCLDPKSVHLSPQSPQEGSKYVITGIAPDYVLNVIVDTFYATLLDSRFDRIVADLYEYVWDSPNALILACGHQLRRFMRPNSWAVEARMRLISFVKRLLENVDADDFQSPAFQKNLAWLVQLLQHPKNSTGEDVPLTLVESVHSIAFFKPKARYRPALRTEPVSLEQRIYSMDPRVVAKSLQRLFLDAFCALRMRDLRKQRFLDANQSPNFEKLVSLFNGLQLYAVNQVLKSDSAKDRQAVIAFFLKVARRSIKLRNFHAGIAIYFAVSDSAVSRLARSWKGMEKKSLQYLASLKAMVDPSNNHGEYSAALRAAAETPPVVPYIGLVSKYLFSMEDANPDKLEDGTTINIQKLRMLHTYATTVLQLATNADSVLNDVASWQEGSLTDYFAYECANPTTTLSDLYEKSLELEPREAKES